MNTKLYLDFIYQIQTGDPIILGTNIKDKRLDEVVLEFVHSQIGSGEDKRNPRKKHAYHITLELDLSDDTFVVSSDTRNSALTLGIMASAVGKWQRASSLPVDKAENLAYSLGYNHSKP